MYIIPYHLNVQGFICPICMEALRSAEALQVHWEAAHSSDRGGGGGANAVSTKLKPQYVTCYIHITHYIMYVRYTLACALMILFYVINPRRACARVTVVALFVCLSVRLLPL